MSVDWSSDACTEIPAVTSSLRQTGQVTEAVCPSFLIRLLERAVLPALEGWVTPAVTRVPTHIHVSRS